MTSRLNLLLFFFLLPAAARASAMTYSGTLEYVAAETANAAAAGSPESAREFSSKALDGLSHARPEIRLEASRSRSGGPEAAAPAARRGNSASKVPVLAHTPPVSRNKRPGALRILLETPLSLITVPVSAAYAGYYMTSKNSYINHNYTAAKTLGALGAVIGFALGLLAAPFVILYCLGKAAKAACSGRW